MEKDTLTDAIVERILSENKQLTMLDMVQGKLEPTELLSLLLKTFENATKKIDAKKIILDHNINRLVQPSNLSQKTILKFDALIYSIVPDKFSSIELSPVNPIGLNTALSNTNQKNVLSTIRNIEVVADVTAALALECAKERRLAMKNNPRNTKRIDICSSHRNIRMQRFSKESDFTSHFRAFGACTAGKNEGNEKFESENIKTHVSIYLDIILRAIANGYWAEDITVYLSDMRITEALISHFQLNRKDLTMKTQAKDINPFTASSFDLSQSIFNTKQIPSSWAADCGVEKLATILSNIEQRSVLSLKEKYPQVKFRFNLARIAGMGYYESLCVKVIARNKKGEIFPLADGGFTDWTKKLLSNNKEMLYIGGFGSELFCRNFKI